MAIPDIRLNLPAGFFQATLRYAGAALPTGAAVVFGGQVPTTGTPTPASVGAQIKTAWTGAGDIYKTGSAWATSVTLADVLVKFGPLVDGPSAVTTIATVLGSGTPPAVNPNTALLVSKQTALGGHVGRGRMFLPGLVATTVGQDGTVLAASVTTFNTDINKTLADMAAAGIPMYLLHTYNATRGDTPRAPTLVSSLNVASKAATQRDRLRR